MLFPLFFSFSYYSTILDEKQPFLALSPLRTFFYVIFTHFLRIWLIDVKFLLFILVFAGGIVKNFKKM